LDVEAQLAYGRNQKPKENMKKLKLAMLAAALATACSASAQLVVGLSSVTTAGGGKYQTVTLTSSTPGGTPKSLNFTQTGIEAGVYNMDLGGTLSGGVQSGGVVTPTFCIDIARSAPKTPNNTYSWSTISSAPENPSGPMTGTQAKVVEQLWAAYGGTSGKNVNASDGLAAGATVDLPALQVAIWEELGNGTLGYTLTVSGNNTVTGDATKYLDYVTANTATLPETPLMALVSGSTQNYIVPVPEPTTMISGALLLLPFAASTLRVLRKNRRV
jgi:hypothetical protein